MSNTKTQHTPGPWTSFGGREIYETANAANAAGVKHVATAFYGNAKLIAAAPEMAEALRELLADKYLADPINAERMAKARAALAKAGL